MVVQHVEHDLQGDLGEDGHHAGHDDLTGHPGNGPIFVKVWTLIISASVGAYHLHYLTCFPRTSCRYFISEI